MDPNFTIINRIKSVFPKLFVTEIINHDLTFGPEKNNGHVEYKRTLVDCGDRKTQKYATQMQWRITENVRHQCAIYYIGVDDDGRIVGLSDDDIINSITHFVEIANTISASIVGIQIIYIGKLTIIKINVKMKKIFNNYFIEAGDII
jgi:GTPase